MNFPKQLLLVFVSFLFLISCQDDPFLEDDLDADMMSATRLADEYLRSSNGRTDGEKAITVLRFYNGNMYFNTNTDDISYYQKLHEESLTAIVQPGEFVFWYAGEGLSNLDGIEFDEESQGYLGDSPEEVGLDLLWVVWIPENAATDKSLLKYDILYRFNGYYGESIRLDPKVKVQN